MAPRPLRRLTSGTLWKCSGNRLLHSYLLQPFLPGSTLARTPRYRHLLFGLEKNRKSPEFHRLSKNRNARNSLGHSTVREQVYL